MARKATELSPISIPRLSKPGLHFVGGVAGLALQITSTGAKSWVLRATIAGKRRDMGLGGFPDVTLAGARDAARMARAAIKSGQDPIQNARSAKSALVASRAKDLSFEQCAAAYIAAHEHGWKNAKHSAQWTATLKTYAYPEFGRLFVRDVELPHILAVLEPLWTVKTVTAVRLRGRIESVIDWAIARSYRQGLNPARWKGHLQLMLASPRKIINEKHYPAIQISQVGQFVQQLREVEGASARALEVLLYTASRSAGVRGMTRQELNEQTCTWTIPAQRMKAGVEHRIPLTDVVIKIIEKQTRIAESDLVFTSPRGQQLSDMAMAQVMRRMNFKDANGDTCVPHGLRSTFRDWCSEHTNYPADVAEMALAHKIPDKVEAAYRRGDLFEKRRRLMEEWAAFCNKPMTSTLSNVVSIQA